MGDSFFFFLRGYFKCSYSSCFCAEILAEYSHSTDSFVFVCFVFQTRRSCWLNAASTPAWSTPATPGRPSCTTARWPASPTASECAATRTTTAASATSCAFPVTTTSATIAASPRGLRCAWTAGWAKTAGQVSCPTITVTLHRKRLWPDCDLLGRAATIHRLVVCRGLRLPAKSVKLFLLNLEYTWLS